MRRILFIFLVAAVLPGSVSGQTPAAPAMRTHVVMLGTGTPASDPDRFGPATVIIVDSTAYLIDAGSGVMRRWAGALRAGKGIMHPTTPGTLFVTHLHSDHTIGLPDVILSPWTQRQQRQPLHIYGPPGIRDMTMHILAAYSEDIRIRTGVRGEQAGSAGPKVDVHEIAPGVVYHDSLVTVTAFAVHHGTWEHAFGYRFQTPDKDIVISGDAAPPSSIPAQCRQCDILIHEGGFYHSADANEYRKEFHTSMEELLDIARLAKPKLLVLYHQGPGPNDAGQRFIQAGYSGGRVVVARDMDIFP